MIVAFVIAVIVSFFVERREEQLIRDMKSKPMAYTYVVSAEGGHIPSLASNDLACLKQIKVEYDSFKKVSRPKYAISCPERYISGDEPVHLLESKDDGEFGNEYVRIALFYTSRKGFDRYYVGYVLRTTIHEKAYKRPAKEATE